MKYAVGIDIGGTNTRVALINENYEIEKKVQFTTNPKDPYETLHQINEVLSTFNCKIQGIGLSCPGPLNLDEQKILTPPNLPGWEYVEIAKELSCITKREVYLENDANLACLAEASLGAGKNCRYVQFLTISTGIGAGFVVDEKIYRGSKGFAQEVANCIFWKDGPRQGELENGSIESISSGSAMVRCAQAAGLSVLHAGEIYDLANSGNKIAEEIINNSYEYLANFISTLYAVLDPEIFVMGGSVALKVDGFIEKVESLVKAKVYKSLADNIHIVRAKLGEDCGLIGGAFLVFSMEKKRR